MELTHHSSAARNAFRSWVLFAKQTPKRAPTGHTGTAYKLTNLPKPGYGPSPHRRNRKSKGSTGREAHVFAHFRPHTCNSGQPLDNCRYEQNTPVQRKGCRRRGMPSNKVPRNKPLRQEKLPTCYYAANDYFKFRLTAYLLNTRSPTHPGYDCYIRLSPLPH